MILSDTAVKRPVFALVINLLLVVFGVVSFSRISLRELPDIDKPIVTIETNYRGASAAIIESRVTRIIEDRITGIEGIETINSDSKDGESSIVVEFSLNRDIDKAASDIRDRVSRILDNLPEQADPPEIFKVDADQQPILWLNVSSEVLTPMALTDYVERYLVDRFSVIDGVARVNVSGSQRYAMRIWLDMQSLVARNVTVDDVERILRQQNVELPGGKIESKDMQFVVRIARGFLTPEDFGNLIVKRGADGFFTRLKDVARVELGPENYRTEFRGNTVPQIGMGFIRQSKANTLSVAKAIKEEAERIRELLPDYIELHNSFDSSQFIEESINEVYSTLYIAVLMVVVVIWLFLGSLRALLVPAATVPVSLIATFIVLYFLGFTINILTLLALILAIGLVVDDSIVVLENVYRRIEEGEPPLLAAYRGTRQVGFAVLATTGVLVSVFLPIAFLQGNVGRLFTEFAVTMSVAVMFSSFCALTLSPMLCSKFLKAGEKRGLIISLIDFIMIRVQALYLYSLNIVLRLRLLVVFLMFGTMWGVVVLFDKIPSEFAPAQDRGVFFIRATGPEGASFHYSSRNIAEVEKRLMNLVGKGEIARVMIRVPGSFGESFAMNDGRATIVMEHWDQRKRSTFALMDELRSVMADIPGVRVFANMPQRISGGGQNPIEFVIGGPDYEELVKWRDIVLDKAQAFGGFTNMDSDFKETRPQFQVKVNVERANLSGVSVESIARTMETLLGSRRVTTYIDGGEEYDVILESEEGKFRSMDDIQNIYVRSDRTSELIKLSDLVDVWEEAGSPSLKRFNRIRAVTISAGLKPGYSLGDALRFLDELVKTELPQQAVVDYKGESREFRRTGQSAMFILILTLIVVYLVLAAQFESLVNPFVIMLTVPLAILGALMGLLGHGETLNIFSQIGILMLVGLAAKNGILIVEFANQLRDEGYEFMEAVREAAKVRLRPILMTTITTLAGSVPLIMASGAGAETRVVIGVVVFWGVAFSTIFTLFVIPAAYVSLSKNSSTPDSVAKNLDFMVKDLDRRARRD